MNFGFAKLQEILAQWPTLEVSQETASDSHGAYSTSVVKIFV